VLIVDDDDLMRAGLRAVLSSDDSIVVVGEAADGGQAVEQVRLAKPDVVLMDVRMPNVDGVTATREIASHTDARVLILTTFGDDSIFGYLSAAAPGLLPKRPQPEQLIAAIHTIAAGESLLSPTVTRTVIDRMARQPQPDPMALRRLRSLTPRERDVLELVARGL